MVRPLALVLAGAACIGITTQLLGEGRHLSLAALLLLTPLQIVTDVEQVALVKDWARVIPSIRETGEPARLTGLGMLRHGTQNGNAVVMLRIELADGSIVVAQTTYALWRVAAQAIAASPIAREEVIDP